MGRTPQNQTLQWAGHRVVRTIFFLSLWLLFYMVTPYYGKKISWKSWRDSLRLKFLLPGVMHTAEFKNFPSLWSSWRIQTIRKAVGLRLNISWWNPFKSQKIWPQKGSKCHYGDHMSIWLLVDLDWRSTCLKTTIFLRKNTVFVILHKYFLTNQRKVQTFLIKNQIKIAYC